jgi:pimeloyl-ACP methyl ester carboxylesterase
MVTMHTEMADICVVSAGGEYMESVTVVAWHKAVGDAVAAGDLLATVETAKAATDIEADKAGTLAEILVEVGSEVEVGGVIGRIATVGASRAAEMPAKTQDAVDAKAEIKATESFSPEVLPAGGPRSVDRIIASPRARRLMKKHGLSPSDIQPLNASGRIKGRDVEAVLNRHLPASRSRHLHVRRRNGKGIPIVFIHGFGSDGRTWNPLMTALRTGQPMVAVDLPGHGGSPHDPVEGITDIAARVIHTLEAEDIYEAHLVGHSLGAAVVMAIAATEKLSVRSLCLIAPAGLGREMDGEFAAQYPLADSAAELQRWMVRLFGDASLVTPQIVAATLEARSDPALRAYQAELAAKLFPGGKQATDLRNEFHAFYGPRRIIWGMNDAIIPWEQSLHLDGCAALNLLPGVGHMPQLEATAMLAQVIAEHIRSAA